MLRNFLPRGNPVGKNAPTPIPPRPDPEPEQTGVDLITFGDVLARCDRQVAEQAMDFRRHYLNDRSEPYWLADDLDDLLGLIAIEGGGCPS